MVKKGVGRWQLDQSSDAAQAIINILLDGEWHRYQELKEKSGLSSATLSKHLKELEKGYVEKEIRLNSGEYPYPVLYRIKDQYHKILAKEQQIITECEFKNYQITVHSEEDIETQTCLEKVTEGLSNAIGQGYDIYKKDRNWIAFQLLAGTANAMYYNGLQRILKEK